MGKKFLAEVTFHSKSKSNFPAAGYRPHFSLPHSDCLMGIVFTDFSGNTLDAPVLAEVEAVGK